MDNSNITIKDSNSILQTDTFQTGFYFAGNSSLQIVGGYDSLGLTGPTGLSSIAIGSTGSTGTTASGADFIIGSANSSGNIKIITGRGKIQVNIIGDPTALFSGGQLVVASGSNNPSRALPSMNVTNLPGNAV